MGANMPRLGMTCGRRVPAMDRAGRLNPSLPRVTVRIVDGSYRIRFERYHEELKEKARQVEGRRWDSVAKEWVAPVTEAATRQLIGFGFLKEGGMPQPVKSEKGVRRGMACNSGYTDIYDGPGWPEPQPEKTPRRGMPCGTGGRDVYDGSCELGDEPVSKGVKAGRRADLVDGAYIVHFPNDKGLVKEMKGMMAKFNRDNPADKFWKVQANGMIKRKLAELGFLPESRLAEPDYGFLYSMRLSPFEVGDVKGSAAWSFRP